MTDFQPGDRVTWNEGVNTVSTADATELREVATLIPSVARTVEKGGSK